MDSGGLVLIAIAVFVLYLMSMESDKWRPLPEAPRSSASVGSPLPGNVGLLFDMYTRGGGADGVLTYVTNATEIGRSTVLIADDVRDVDPSDFLRVYCTSTMAYNSEGGAWYFTADPTDSRPRTIYTTLFS